MSKIKCPKCHSMIRAGASYCERCGLKIPIELKFEPSRTGDSSAPKLAGGIVIAFMLVGIAILIVFLVNRPSIMAAAEQDAKAKKEAEAEQWLADKRQKDSEDKRRMELSRGILIVQKLHQIAKVPDSVKILSAKVSGNLGAVCVEYTANNSFNAALRGFAIVDPDGQIYFDDIDLKLFKKKYIDYCAYTVRDITYDVNYYYPLIP